MTVIFLWPWDRGEPFAATLLNVLATTPAETKVTLPAGAFDRRLLESIDRGSRERLTSVDCPPHASFAQAMNDAVRASGAADVIVIADACIPPEGWLERLRRAAHADDTTAAASPLRSGEGDAMFEGFDAIPALPNQEAEDGEVAVAAVHPRILTLWPHCAYLRRDALELLGSADDLFSHPAAVLADLAARVLAHGMSCVLADDVCVERLAGGLPACPETEMRQLSERYPWIDTARDDTTSLDLGPLRRSLIAARVARTRLAVTIDARSLGPSLGGTQTYTTALVRALARYGRVRLRVVIAKDASALAIEQFTEHGNVEIVTYEQAVSRSLRTDVVHRPHQVFTPEDLTLLRLLGERLVVTHLDLISYRNPLYHASPHEWRSYRRTTRLALAIADRVIFLSEYARRDALAEDLIDLDRTAVAGIGIEQIEGGEPGRRPERVPPGRPLLVMIGADYLHKNRAFALQIVDQLRRRHGWDGLLVLAGAHVPYGSSAGAEAEWLRANRELDLHVLDLGPVNQAEKRWLLDEAQALLCPSIQEGYGLTPMEAAAGGLPCIYAASTSLSEVVGAEGATVVPWDATATADAVRPLLTPGRERDRHLTLLSQALRRHDWEPIVERLRQVYEEAFRSPFRASNPRAWKELEREERLAQLESDYRDLRSRVAPGLPLIERGGLLTPAQQRGLMRVASRRWLRGPALGAFGLLGNLRGDRERDSD